jgi:hypothetical protein
VGHEQPPGVPKAYGYRRMFSGSASEVVELRKELRPAKTAGQPETFATS